MSRANEQKRTGRNGFTLIELLLVLALMGILLSIGFASFQALLRSTALDSATEDAAALLTRARWMAMTSGANRIVNLSSPPLMAIETADGTVLRSTNLSAYDATYASSKDRFTLDPRGFLSPPATVTLAVSAGTDTTRTVTINPVGRVRKQ